MLNEYNVFVSDSLKKQMFEWNDKYIVKCADIPENYVKVYDTDTLQYMNMDFSG